MADLAKENIESSGGHGFLIHHDIGQRFEKFRSGSGVFGRVDVKAEIPQRLKQLLVLGQPVSQLEGERHKVSKAAFLPLQERLGYEPSLIQRSRLSQRRERLAKAFVQPGPSREPVFERRRDWL